MLLLLLLPLAGLAGWPAKQDGDLFIPLASCSANSTAQHATLSFHSIAVEFRNNRTNQRRPSCTGSPLPATPPPPPLCGPSICNGCSRNQITCSPARLPASQPAGRGGQVGEGLQCSLCSQRTRAASGGEEIRLAQPRESFQVRERERERERYDCREGEF